jgi:predicted nucleic acid-binding protein
MKVAVLDLLEGYWMRAADSRAKMLSQKRRARLPDTLIAQSCIDHNVLLITRDADFRHFAKHCGLKLA